MGVQGLAPRKQVHGRGLGFGVIGLRLGGAGSRAWTPAARAPPVWELSMGGALFG